MAEARYEVNVYAVEYRCDACQTPMRYADFFYPNNPPQYKHQCPNPNCRKIELLPSKYPELRFDRKKSGVE